MNAASSKLCILYLFEICFQQIENSQPKLSHGQISELIRRWFIEDKGDHQKFLWERDEETVEWLIEQVQKPFPLLIIATFPITFYHLN